MYLAHQLHWGGRVSAAVTIRADVSTAAHLTALLPLGKLFSAAEPALLST